LKSELKAHLLIIAYSGM